MIFVLMMNQNVLLNRVDLIFFRYLIDMLKALRKMLAIWNNIAVFLITFCYFAMTFYVPLLLILYN